MTSKFTIIIDSREQRSYTFQGIKPEPPATIIQGLKTGDYSVQGMEHLVCAERKSLTDLFGSVGNGRARFEREMVRMSEMQYGALIIEAQLSTIFTNPPSRSKMNPRSVFRTLISWSQKYNVHVWPVWDREAAEKVTYLILKRFYDDKVKGRD